MNLFPSINIFDHKFKKQHRYFKYIIKANHSQITSHSEHLNTLGIVDCLTHQIYYIWTIFYELLLAKSYIFFSILCNRVIYILQSEKSNSCKRLNKHQNCFWSPWERWKHFLDLSFLLIFYSILHPVYIFTTFSHFLRIYFYKIFHFNSFHSDTIPQRQ